MGSILFGLAIPRPPVESLVSSGYQSELLAKTLIEEAGGNERPQAGGELGLTSGRIA
jgi:hypothetical protein